MILFESRACGILYNLLRSLAGDLPFLLPANVCPDVPRTFREAGRDFRLLDLDLDDLGMDRRRCLEVVAERPEAWAGVHYVRPYGAEVEEVDGFFRALKELRPGLLAVDDRCLCLPDCAGERLAPAADVTLFSTGRAKPVDLGFGGFAHCRDEVPYQRWESPGESWLDLSVPVLGWDAYRTLIQEALPGVEEHRRRLNALYASALPDEIQLPARFQGWRFHILVPEPDALVERLFAAGLFASRHYAPLGGIFSEERFPVAERLHRGIVNLFNDRYFDEERARRTVDCVLRHLAGCGPTQG
ncbi:MAG TPA: hypothetical protein VGS07_32340 [Thermoanaerobaculia bacterium]|jgi:hypothetical protein|nr:hypothetical protein [Thermoanaerobaculia bacterium]